MFRPRILRPYLSPRHPILTRSSTTAAQPSPSFFQRNRSAIISTALALGLGALAGQVVIHSVAPPPLPEPWSREDGLLIADLNRRIDDDFKVKILRGKCLGVAKALKGGESGWVEVVKLPVDLAGKEQAGMGRKLLESMEGAGGLGVERLFWDKREKKLVAVVWFGGSLCGWPGVTHGGAIATLLAEKVSMAATLADTPAIENGTLAAAMPQRLPGTGNHAKMLAPASAYDEPSQLSLNYVKPTYANKFYVIRVAPALEKAEEVAEPARPAQVKKVSGGSEWEATLETMDATSCVLGRAKFAPSTTVQKAEEKTERVVGKSYKDFKEWMWPSRQEIFQGR